METINAALGLSGNNGYNHLTLNRVMDTQTIYKINQVEGKNPSGDTIDFFTLTAIIARSESRSEFYKKHKLIKKIVDGLEATGAAEAFYASAVLIGATAIEEYIPQKYKNTYTEGTSNAIEGAGKSLSGYGAKSESYLTKRGWTWNSAQDVVGNPYTTREAVNKATGNSATVFYNKAGDYVVRDNVTGELVQTSKFGDVNWIPDSSIINPYKP